MGTAQSELKASIASATNKETRLVLQAFSRSVDAFSDVIRKHDEVAVSRNDATNKETKVGMEALAQTLGKAIQTYESGHQTAIDNIGASLKEMPKVLVDSLSSKATISILGAKISEELAPGMATAVSQEIVSSKVVTVMSDSMSKAVLAAKPFDGLSSRITEGLIQAGFGDSLAESLAQKGRVCATETPLKQPVTPEAPNGDK